MRNYKTHCAFFDYNFVFFAFLISLASWLNEIDIDDDKFAEMMKKYIIDVKSTHIDLSYNHKNIENVFSHDQIERIYRNIKCFKKITATQRKSSIIKNILLLLLIICDMNIIVDVNYHVVFCLTFVDFFRLSEIIYENGDIFDFDFDFFHVIRSSIAFVVNSIILILSIFKIDFFRRDVAISIAAIDDAVCSLISLKNLFYRCFKNLNESLFDIFRKFFKRMINFQIDDKLRILNIFRFSSCYDFFFKTNAVTWVKQMSLSNRKIKLFDRWKFDVFNIYIHNDINMILNAFKRFQHQSNDFTN